MKYLILLTLLGMLYIELSYGLSIESKSFRIRRDAGETAELDPKRKELLQFARDGMVKLIKSNIEGYKTSFAKIVDQAEKSELKSDALKQHTDKFQKIIERTNELFKADFENEDMIDKIFDLSSDADDLTDEYDRLDNPTEEQKLIQKLIDESDADTLNFELISDFVLLRNQMEERIGDYIESLTAAEKEQQKDFTDWYENFKTAKGAEATIKTTKALFGMLKYALG